MNCSIAIVGTGPAGFYLADLLSKKLEHCQLDLIDRLPTPFGLIRAAVAPDHIPTKNITRQFERVLQRENVRFLGNVELGRDVSYDELKACYNVVIIATGAIEDRALNLEIHDTENDPSIRSVTEHAKIEGIYGSGQFVTWYNAHPDRHDFTPKLDGKAVAIIGNGNVALDIARILGKTNDEMIGSDISLEAQRLIAQSAIEDIYIIGRRGPVEASFTPFELEELSQLSRCVPLIYNADNTSNTIPQHIGEGYDNRESKIRQKNLELLQHYSQNQADQKPIRLHFLFWHSPNKINTKNGRIASLNLKKTQLQGNDLIETDQALTLTIDTLISAIGYRSTPISGVPFEQQSGRIAHKAGRVESGVYCVGWCKRGPQGVIPSNRADAIDMAKMIIADLEANPITQIKTGPAAMDQLLDSRDIRVVSTEDWHKIDQAEIERAPKGKIREKFMTIEQMLATLD